MPHERIRSRLLLLVVAVALLGVALPGGGEPAAAAGPKVTLSASTGLRRGEEITVEWSDFTPDGFVYLHQCTTGTTSWRQCSEPTRVVARSDASGAGSTTFTVWGGDIPAPLGIGEVNDPLTCAGTSCMLAVSECGFDLNASRTVTKVLGITAAGANPTTTTSTSSTTTSSTTVPPPPTPAHPPLNAVTDSDSQLLQVAWRRSVAEEPIRATVNLTQINAPTALEEFVLPTTTGADFAISNLPLSELQRQQLTDGGRGFAYVPIALSALVMGFERHIHGLPVEELRLASSTLADVYRGNITGWNSPTVATDMGGCKFVAVTGLANNFVPGYRTDRSGANLLFSSWLQATAPDTWGPAIEPTGGPSVQFPALGAYGEQYAEPLAAMVDLGHPDKSDPADTRINEGGRFAFFDRSLADHRHLRTVSVRNGAGEWVQPTDEAILLAVDAATDVGDGFLVADPLDDTPGAYPMPMLTYAVVPTTLTDQFTAEEGVALREVLTALVGADGQAMAEDLGFVPLTDELRATALSAIAEIPIAAPVPSTTSTTSTTTVTTSTSTTTTTLVLPTAPPPPPFDPGFSAGPSFSGGSGGGSGAGSFATPPPAPMAPAVPGDADTPSDPGAVEQVVERTRRLLASSGGLVGVPSLLAVGLAALAIGPTLRLGDGPKDDTDLDDAADVAS